MNQIFEDNLRELARSLPNIHKALLPEIEKFKTQPQGDAEESFGWVEEPGRPVNLKYKRRVPAFEGLYHDRELERELRQVFKDIDLNYPQLVFFFGIGLGHALFHFWKNRPPRNKAILILERNPQIFLRSLCVYSYQDLFARPDVHIVVNSPVASSVESLNRFLSQFTTTSRHLKIIACPSAIKTEGEFYSAVGSHIVKMRDLITIGTGNSVQDQFIGVENLLANVQEGLKNQGIAKLRGLFEGKTIISIAAGPSARHHWERIRSLQDRVPLVACDVLLREMNRQRIEPDFVCALERVPLVASFFDQVPVPERTSLVGPLLLHPDVFKKFQGRKLIYNPGSLGFGFYGLSRLHDFYPGSSAGNLNFAFAKHLGFKNVILVGQDLSFGLDNSMSHTPGTGLETQERALTPEEIKERSGGRRVETQDGLDEVPTTFVWNIFREQIEVMQGLYPDDRLINTSPKGAKIRGAELMSLEEAIEEFVTEDLSIWKDFQHIYTEVTQEAYEERLQDFMYCANSVIDRLEHWAEKAQKIEEKIKKWKSHIEDREQRNRKPSLAFLDDCLNEVLYLKTQAVNHDPAFHLGFLQQISPAHLAFERELNAMPGSYKDNYLLKRDFLLKHENYFAVWNQWIPVLLEGLKNCRSALSKT
ncbi:MAG: DUF115 domain-containing protein [Bradymonadales bacterium]|nr:MAG: DUF115 domain-containing protein [Bradymonadales bacterium]